MRASRATTATIPPSLPAPPTPADARPHCQPADCGNTNCTVFGQCVRGDTSQPELPPAKPCGHPGCGLNGKCGACIAERLAGAR